MKMKKDNANWLAALAAKAGPQFWPQFEENAKNAGAEIFKAANIQQAVEIVVNLVKFTNAKKVVGVDGLLPAVSSIIQPLTDMNVAVYTQAADIAEHAESADIGISAVEFAIGESGSICMDSYSFESRLVSMLPPLHIVFLNSHCIVAGIEEAFDTIAQTYDSGYISFITGPSRTADIERVLTIGVHGPSRLVIIAIDEDGGVH